MTRRPRRADAEWRALIEETAAGLRRVLDAVERRDLDASGTQAARLEGAIAALDGLLATGTKEPPTGP